jgi:hypothetical protein
MSKKEKLLQKFLATPLKKNLTFSELETLMNSLNYQIIQGKGSRIKFYNKKTKDLLCLHKPHPSNILKTYQISLIQQKLISNNYEQYFGI